MPATETLPQPSDFQDYDDYVEAYTAWVIADQARLVAEGKADADEFTNTAALLRYAPPDSYDTFCDAADEVAADTKEARRYPNL